MKWAGKGDVDRGYEYARNNRAREKERRKEKDRKERKWKRLMITFYYKAKLWFWKSE